MKTTVVVHSAALTSGNNTRALREGSSVYVRVLKNNGSGSYKISLAGKTVDIKSSVPLEVGASFKAEISLIGSKIVLRKQDFNIQLEDAKLQKLPVIFNSEGKIVNPKLIQYFANLGLFPDEISYELFNLTKELGSRFDSETINKARLLGLKFKGREKKASAAAFILLQKGLNPDKEMIEALLGEDEGGSFYFDTKDAQQNSSKRESFDDFFNEVFSGYYGENRKTGLLTLFNHLCFNNEKQASFGNWIKVPFDFKYTKQTQKTGCGCFSAFLDKDRKETRKVVLDFNFADTKYGICICLRDNKPNKIILASPTGKSDVSVGLKNHFASAEIEEIDYDDFYSFMPEDDGISILGGSV